MKFTIKKNILLENLSNTIKAISTKNVIPIQNSSQNIQQKKVEIIQKVKPFQNNIYNIQQTKSEIIQKLNINSHQNGYNIDKDILKYFSEIGINDISSKSLKQHWLEIQKRDYNLNPKFCEYCGKILPFEKRNSKCCNQSCGTALGNKKKGYRTEETKRKRHLFPDGYIEELNLIIEFHGSFWHADIRLFPNDDSIVHHNKTAKECRNENKNKEILYKSLGYNYIEIWSYDFLKNKEQCIQDTLNKIKTFK